MFVGMLSGPPLATLSKASKKLITCIVDMLNVCVIKKSISNTS